MRKMCVHACGCVKKGRVPSVYGYTPLWCIVELLPYGGREGVTKLV